MENSINNIQFNYLYRDAGNYKVHGNVIFSNPEGLTIPEIENELRRALIDTEFFDPSEFKLPRLRHEDLPYDPELDHSWNEFSSLEETAEPATESGTITDFLLRINVVAKQRSF